MIVPEYWSEAKTQITDDGKQRTILRFGWSDTSEADAHRNAKQRVDDAIRRIRAGESVHLRDHKIAYNGAEGLPIREEVIERHGETVITRNAYGALCLNTPDVVFADVDVQQGRGNPLIWFVFFAILVAGFLASRYFSAWWPLGIAAVIGIAISAKAIGLLGRSRDPGESDPFVSAKARIEKFAADNPRWLLRLYRTPNGYRVLIMHDTFDPTQEDAFDFMQQIDSDPFYVRMCRNQKCFRARISPKPWRIDMQRIRPGSGVWPLSDDKIAARRDWIRRYERQSDRYAACRYLETLGNGRTDRKCDEVRKIHDRYCKAERDLEIA
jgi:hypothetical protein